MKHFILILAIIATSSHLSLGQFAIPEIAFAGKTVKDIINDMEGSGNRLLQNAQTAGNNVASKFGNEILVATQNLQYYFSESMNKTFNNLKIEEQNLFVEINKIIDAFNNTNQNITTLSEMTNLDLIAFTNRISLLTRKVDYYISSINGTTVINSDAGYTVNVTGIGFGLNDSRQQYNTTVYVNNNLLPVTAIDLTQRRQMRLNVPNNLIKPLFRDNTIVFVPVKIVSSITQPGGFLGWSTTTSTYETRFRLVLMPKIAGTITVSETVSKKVLGDDVLTHAISRSFQGCKTDQPCEMIESWSCNQNQRIVGVRYTCTGQCGWSYNKRRGGYDADYDILNDNTSVTVYRHLDGQNPTTVIHYIDYKNYRTDYQQVNNGTIQLKYGEPFDILLNKENQDCNYTIVGKLTTGQTINYNNNTISNSPFLKLLGIGRTGESCKASFRLVTP